MNTSYKNFSSASKVIMNFTDLLAESVAKMYKYLIRHLHASVTDVCTAEWQPGIYFMYLNAWSQSQY